MKIADGAQSPVPSQNPYAAPVARIVDPTKALQLRQALLGFSVASITIIALMYRMTRSSDEIVLRLSDLSELFAIAIVSSLPYLVVRVRWYWIVLVAPILTVACFFLGAIVMKLLLG